MREGLSRHDFGVILAGGSGTRLWPLSTKKFPKQFLSIGSEQSLLAQTAQRLTSSVPPENLWLVCGAKHGEDIADHIDGMPPEQILIEPQARNTAPAITLAALHLQAKDPEALMMVLPADHLILKGDWEIFSQDLALAARIARERKALVTLGVPPLFPSTGFGYLEKGESYDILGRPYFQLKGFKEKPDLQTARRYLSQGIFFWNSGMFVWEVQTYLNELEHCQPEMYGQFQKLRKSLGTSGYFDKLAQVFSEVESVSIDYAVMEKARQTFMVPARFGWDDVGSLEAFVKMIPEDITGNYSQGDVFTVDSRNNLVVSRTKPVALVGVEDMVVIESAQAVLVLPRNRAQEVKSLVESLREKGREDLI